MAITTEPDVTKYTTSNKVQKLLYGNGNRNPLMTYTSTNRSFPIILLNYKRIKNILLSSRLESD